MFDGVGFHKEPQTLEWLTTLGYRIIIAGPYGYLGSPIELAFGFLKQVDLNPENKKTGKK